MIAATKTKEWNQAPGESYEDWKYRVILGKRDGKAGLSWSEVCRMLGLSCGAEHIRKIATGIAKYRDYLNDKNIESLTDAPQSAIDAIDQKHFDLRKQKMQMQDQKRELNKLLREWARAEHIQEEMKKSIEKLPKIAREKDINLAPLSEYEKEAVLMLSDWHVGMVTANCTNTFNTKILEDRVCKLQTRVLEICNKEHVRRVHIFCLGDLVHGLIHVTARIQSEEDVVRQSMLAAELLANLLNTVSEHVPVDLYWARGNHDRISPNKKESIAKESFADLILWYLKARLSDIDEITFHENETDDEIIVTDIMGHTIFAAHGHKDRPTKTVENLSLLLKEFPDFVLLGHFHSAAEREVQGAEILVNGSLCGTDDYAMSLRKTSKPSQKMMILSEEGRVCTYNINL